MAGFLSRILRRGADFTLSPRSARSETRLFKTAITDPALPLSPNEFFDKVRRLVLEHCLHDTAEYKRQAASLAVQFTSLEEAALAARNALTALGDNHTELLDARQTGRLEDILEDRDGIYNVDAQLQDDDAVGYLCIRTFMTWNTVEKTRSALKQLAGAEALVLDLRWNGGGLLSEAFEVYEMLADDGEFIALEGTTPQRFWLTETEACTVELDGSVERQPRKGNLTGEKPLVILVNEETASAAEAMARALKANRGARIVGMPTTGKDTAQRFWRLDCGTCLKLTFARQILSGAGANGGEQRVMPDFQVPYLSFWDAQRYVAHVMAHSMFTVNRYAGGNFTLKDPLLAFDYLYCLVVRDFWLRTETVPGALERLRNGLSDIERRHAVGIHLAGGLFDSGVKLTLWDWETDSGVALQYPALSGRYT